MLAFQLGNGLETVDLLEKKGRQFSTTRQWGKAQAVYRQVLQLREKEWGREDVRLIQPLNDVIRVTCVDGRCADTVPYLNRLLAIRLKKFGRQHADVATTYALIAEANEKMHRYPAALKNFGEAVKIRDLLYGKTDALAISSRVNMIRVFLKNNDKPAARKVMEECQALLKARGKPAPELDKVLSYYGEKF